MTRLLRAWPLLLALALLSPQALSHTKVAKRHLLLVMQREASGFRILSRTLVDAPLPKQRAGKARSRGAWRVRLEDTRGKELFAQRIPDPSRISAKFHGEAGDHHIVQQPPYSFALRVPLLPAARISLDELETSQRRKLSPPKEAWREMGRLAYPELSP